MTHVNLLEEQFHLILIYLGGNNNFFKIENIELYPNNTVQIYNRWGVIVYEMQGYDNNPNTAFRGISNGRATVQKTEELPVGIYFYIIKYENGNDSS